MVEDYVFYIYREVVNEIMEMLHRYPWLMSVDVLESHMYKKLALLVALKLCYTKVEELFHRGLSDSGLDELLQLCDGLSSR